MATGRYAIGWNTQAEVWALLALMGATGVLALKSLVLGRRGPLTEPNLWATLWNAAALVYIAGRLLQLTADAPEAAVLGGRLRFAAGVSMTFVALGIARALGGLRGLPAWLRRYGSFVLGVVALIVGTDLVTSDTAIQRVDALGRLMWSAEPGPLLIWIAAPMAAGTVVVVVRVLRGSEGLSDVPLPVTRREIRVLAVLMIVAVANDITVHMGWSSSIRVFHWAFAITGLLISWSQDLRVTALFERLEETVDERTVEARAGQTRYQLLAEATREGIALHRDGVVVDVNPAWETLFGTPRAETLGRPLGEFFEDPALFDRLGDVIEPTRVIARAAGRSIPVEVANRLGDAPGAVLTVLDLRERERAEAKLAQADRLASLGTLAAGAAHEINNPLSAVATNAFLLLERLEDDASMSSELRAELLTLAQEMREGCARVQDTVRDLKTLTREPPTTLAPVALLPLVKATAQLARHELRHRASLVIDVPERVAVQADEGRLGQVLLNLLLNAAQALAPGGAENEQVIVRARAQGRMVSLEVEDTGSGIAPEHLPQVFDPFFTTKPQGEGTGLGLSIAHGIVRALEGSISVTSTVGAGTRFTVRLPRAVATPEERRVQDSGAPQMVRARVLVVDDDAVVGRTLARALRDHEVETTTDPREGLRRCRDTAFDVVLCDVMMPEMTGPQLLRRLAETEDARTPANSVVFISGGTFAGETREDMETLPNPLLEKPIEVAALRALVQTRALAAGPSVVAELPRH